MRVSPFAAGPQTQKDCRDCPNPIKEVAWNLASTLPAIRADRSSVRQTAPR